MRVVSRRFILGASMALPALRSVSAAEKARSEAASHGAAPFTVADLIPGAPLDLSAVDPNHPAARVIALTIDDGPDPNDLHILDTLRRHGAKATFFYIGHKLAEHRAIAERVAASGNEVGNHTQNHPMMTDVPAATRFRNLAEADAELARIGVRPAWFRPPYGDFDAAVEHEARLRGLQTVLWTVDSKDWKGLDAATIRRRVVERLAPGAVVLMHSTRPASVHALPDIIEAGTRQGFRFVTMTEWEQAMLTASLRSAA